MAARDSVGSPAVTHALLASSNSGKLREFQELASGSGLSLDLLPGFAAIPPFDEAAPTFAENAAGKALYYSRFTDQPVLADDSGLVVPALGGAPGVQSARYGGPNATSEDRIQKLLREMRDVPEPERAGRFVCVIAVAWRGRALVVASDFVEGRIVSDPRGDNGFGYDPAFLLPVFGRTMAELSAAEKNKYSHRGRAFRKLRDILLCAGTPPLFEPRRIQP